MKKKLLLAAVAFASVIGAQAFNVGDYIYTATQRLQIVGANQIANGAFEDGTTTGFTDAAGNAVDASVWSFEGGMGPEGENVLTSMGATADAALCGQWTSLDPGNYVVSFAVKAPTETNSATDVSSNNYINVQLNTKTAGGNDSVAVVSSQTYLPAEWKTVNFLVTVSAPEDAVALHFEKFETGMSVTNFALHKVKLVYDLRPLENKIAFARRLIDEPAFNVPEAAAERDELVTYLDSYKDYLADGTLDDFQQGQDFYDMIDEYLNAYLDVTSVDLVKFIPGLDISSLSFWSRGGAYNKNYKLSLGGGNWGHLASEVDVLRSAIQKGFGNTATYSAYHEDLPAGKYFFSCEVRNANTARDAWPTTPTFNLTTEGCQIFIGKDSTEVEAISGENFQPFYKFGEIANDGEFYAGFYWPGVSSGGAFFIRNTVMRVFDKEVVAKTEYIQAWKKYIEQWKAATDARHTLIEMQQDANYPWDKQVLNDAREKWDPYYKAQLNRGWVEGDYEDAGRAWTAGLLDWALYQGVEEYDEPTEEGAQPKRKEYQVVRGYQGAVNSVKATNKPFSDLATAIDEAKKQRNLGTNVTGDRDAYKAAIEAAINTITTVRNTTTDATRVADSTTLANALETLKAAGDTFMGTVTGSVVLADIDFSNSFEEATDEFETPIYVVNGTTGRMEFDQAKVQLDNTVADWNFALGYNGELEDVLHVGGDSYGVVKFVPAGDADVLSVNFDLWYGQLGKGFMDVIFVNEAGQRVAGFSYDCYNNSIGYNDFDNDANTGMAIKGKVKSNHDKNGGAASVCTDALRNSFELTIDYSKQTLKGKMVNASNTIEGVEVPFPEVEDNKIVALKIGSSTYAKANSGATGRRCWFDNLKIMKLVGSDDLAEDIEATGWAPKPENVDYDEVAGIRTVSTQAKGNVIYNLAGARVNSMSKPGLYIVNGKKVIIK